MRIDVVTIFPEMLRALTDFGVSGRAIERGLIELRSFNPRDYATDRHRTVDDRPYGGGPGMVMMGPPLAAALEAAKGDDGERAKVVYMSPAGRPLRHENVIGLARVPHLVLLAGRYEGVDARLLDAYIDEQWSVGEYVLSGGELAAMVLVDAIIRQLPGALGNAESAVEESFAQGLLDCDQYTRPEVFAGRPVPPVLLSGDHGAIKRWRRKQALGRTWLNRPDLLGRAPLTPAEQALLLEFQEEHESEKNDD